MDIGKKIKLLRCRYHMTQEELCKRLNITRSTLHRYEKGNVDSLSVKTLEKMSKAFHCNIVDLIDDVEINEALREYLSKWKKRFSTLEDFNDYDFIIQGLINIMDYNTKIQGARIIDCRMAWQNMFIEGLIQYFLIKKNQDECIHDTKHHEHSQSFQTF